VIEMIYINCCDIIIFNLQLNKVYQYNLMKSNVLELKEAWVNVCLLMVIMIVIIVRMLE